MACNTIHLTEDSDYGCLALNQGESLNYPPGRCLSFVIVGEGITSNLVNWAPSGQITSNYFDKSPVIYATFTFDSLQFGSFSVSDGSTQTGLAIAPKLTLAQSEAIPIPKVPWTGVDGALVGKNCWLYEIRLTSPDGTTAIDIVPPSYVQINGRAAA